MREMSMVLDPWSQGCFAWSPQRPGELVGLRCVEQDPRTGELHVQLLAIDGQRWAVSDGDEEEAMQALRAAGRGLPESAMEALFSARTGLAESAEEIWSHFLARP